MPDDRDIRPDLAFELNQSMEDFEEDYDLEEADKGFHCENCGWRALSFPASESPGDILDCICPECEEPGVTNLLTKHINIIKDEYADDPRDWVPYTYFVRRFTSTENCLNDALNHMLTGGRAYVVFEEGTPLLWIETEEEDL